MFNGCCILIVYGNSAKDVVESSMELTEQYNIN